MEHAAAQLKLLALCRIKGVSWDVVARTASSATGLERLLRGEVVEVSDEAARTRTALATGLDQLDAHERRVTDDLDRAHGIGAHLVTVLDDVYPANLRVVFNAPPFLFVRGELRREDALAVAVVGTRQASDLGLARAREMARGLVERGVTVLSGLALGIDTAAHEETLEHGGRTIAVLGTGILRAYPAENRELAERIAAAGALVSQFWPDQPPTRYTFPRRNIVTSGMSQGTAVIEASSTSGAKMQARLALQHGKRVFLLDELVTRQPWARGYLERHPRRAFRVADVPEILERLSSSESIEQISAGRRQLALDFG